MSLAREIQQKYQRGERQFIDEILVRQNFSFQVLDDCDFSGADLSHANLSAVSLKTTNFQHADLSYSICTNADFTDANLTATNLTAANLSNATFLNAIYNDQTQFPAGFDPAIAGAINISQPREISQTPPEPKIDTDIEPIEHTPNLVETEFSAEQETNVEEETTLTTSIQSLTPISGPADKPDLHTSSDIEALGFEALDFEVNPDERTSDAPVSPFEFAFDNPSDKLTSDHAQGSETTEEANLSHIETNIATPEEEILSTIEHEKTIAVAPNESTVDQPTQDQASKTKKKKRWIWILALCMPALGGLAYLGIDTYQTYQTQREILDTVNNYRENKKYESCLQEISSAEASSPKTIPFLDFENRLNVLKDFCQEQFAVQNLNEGLDLMDSNRNKDAIAMLSKIPKSTDSYPTAKSKIKIAGEEYCGDLMADAQDSGHEDQFQAVLEEGKQLPTTEPIADECKQEMASLQAKWEENIPALTEAETLLAEGDCKRGQLIANSLSRSIFQKWQRTAQQLAEDVSDCKIPIDISANLRNRSTHTFKGVAGQMIQIDLRSSDFDPIVRLLDANGNELGKDDDGGPGKNSRLKHKLTRQGDFTVKVSVYGSGTGNYSLKVTR